MWISGNIEVRVGFHYKDPNERKSVAALLETLREEGSLGLYCVYDGPAQHHESGIDIIVQIPICGLFSGVGDCKKVLHKLRVLKARVKPVPVPRGDTDTGKSYLS